MDDILSGMSHLERNQAYLSERITNLQLAQADRDTCEVRVSGIPRELTTDSASITTAAHKVLEKIGCTRAIPHIYKTREFKINAVPSPHSGIIAIQFSSPVARDDVISSSRKLKGVTAKSLFGTGDEIGIFINYILPTNLHKIDTAARKHAHAINYPPPITRPQAVFMRQTLEGPLIPITTTADLSALTPNIPTSNPSSM